MCCQSMGLEFDFPFRGNCKVGSSTISELLKGLRVTCAVFKGLKGKHGSVKGRHEPWDGSCRIKTGVVESFRGGFCGLRSRGSSIVSTRIGQGGNNVIGRTRRRGLRALGDREGIDEGFQNETSSTDGASRSIDGAGEDTSNGSVSAGVGSITGGTVGASTSVGGAGIAGAGNGIISRQPAIKVIVTHIKAANGVVKGVKAANGVLAGLKNPLAHVVPFVGTDPGILVVWKAAKCVVKGFKVSKGVVAAAKAYSERFGGRWGGLAGGRATAGMVAKVQGVGVMVKRMKAPAAAVKIVRMAMGMGKDLRECGIWELLNWSTLRKGYKFSKSTLTVFEVVTSLKGGMISMVGKGVVGAHKAVEGVGVVLKALWLSKEVYVVILKGLAMSKGACEAFLAISEKRKSSAGALSSCEGVLSDEVRGTAVSAPVSLFDNDRRRYLGLPLRVVRLTENRCSAILGDSRLALPAPNRGNTNASSTLTASVGEFPCTYLGGEDRVRTLFSLAIPV